LKNNVNAIITSWGRLRVYKRGIEI